MYSTVISQKISGDALLQAKSRPNIKAGDLNGRLCFGKTVPS